jgi:hypothetical protein
VHAACLLTLAARTDIIEGVNTQTQDASTLHTNAGCAMTSAWQNASAVMTGEVVDSANCEVSNVTNVRVDLSLPRELSLWLTAPLHTLVQGCGVYTPANSYGVPFNDASGGVYILGTASRAGWAW